MAQRLTRAGALVFLPILALALTPGERKLVEAVRAEALRGHVSFLASDLLEGRDTPSPGLEIAAEYIAAHFRGLGLEPLPGGSYFQLAPYTVTRQPVQGFRLELKSGDKTVTIDAARALATAAGAVSLDDAECVKVSLRQEDAPLPAREAVAGKVILLDAALFRTPAMAAKRDALLELGARSATAAIDDRAAPMLDDRAHP